jgi:serine/threonine-protein kinase RsbW
MNRKNERYGTRRLLEIVKQYCRSNPQALTKRIIEDNIIFRGTQSLQDDLTIFCIQLGCSDEILENSGFGKFDYPEMMTLNRHNEIESVCSVILSNLDKKGYKNIDIFKTHQSIHEILSNAIQHGNKFNSEKTVMVFYKILLDSFRISVVDEGNGFNYSRLPKVLSNSKKKKVRGKGLYIVKQFMDEIKFNDKGNRVLIFKHQTQES